MKVSGLHSTQTQYSQWGPVGQPTTKLKRRYSAEDTKSVLLHHAERAFTAAGFDDVGVRDIAQAASVNPALVNRYFGSKQGLFEAVLEAQGDAGDLLGREQATWGRVLAAVMVKKVGTEPDVDPFLILLRSAQSKSVGEMVHRSVECRLIEPFALHYGSTTRARMKSRLILSVILGVDVIERVVKLPHDPDGLSDFEDILGQALQAIVDA